MDPVTLSKAKRYAESLIGDSVGMELRQSGGNIEWRQSGGEWAVLIPVNDLLGPGVPPGGDTGQVLSKASGTSGDTEWATPFDGDYDSLSNKPTLGSAAAEDASAFASADHAHGLGDLTDVDLSGIATGETIVWDGGGFTPGAASGGDMLKADYDSVGNGVVNEARAVLWDGVTNRPSEFPPSAHSHPASEITGLQGLLDDKANVVSGSGTRVPTFTGGTQDSGGVALDTDATAGTVALRGAGGVVSVGAPTSPAHAATKKYVDDTVGDAGGGDMLKSEYDSVGDGVVNEARAVAWAGVTDKPSTFTPSIHSHGMSDVTGLPEALNGKANATHSHSQSDITGLADALSGKADTSHQHSAGDITSGTLSVARGGTGATSFTSGSFLQGSGTGALTARTPAQVLGDIGAAPATHAHGISDVTGLQAALDAAGGAANIVYLEVGDDWNAAYAAATQPTRFIHAPGVKALTSPLVLPGDHIYEYYGCTITQANGANLPYLATTPTYLSNVTWVDAPLMVLGGAWEGNTANNTTPVSGLVLRTYYSTVRDATVRDVSEHGFVYSALSSNDTAPTNTAVENGWYNCRVYMGGNTTGIPFYGRDDSPSRLTDGFLINCVSEGGRDGVVLDSAAGWHVSGYHGYNIDRFGMMVSRAFATTVADVYLEGFGQGESWRVGIYAQNVSVRGLTIMGGCVSCDEAGGTTFGVFVSGEAGATVPVAIALACAFDAGSNNTAIALEAPTGTTINATVSAAASGHQALVQVMGDGTVNRPDLDPLYINPQQDGSVEVVFDHPATLNLGAVRVRGTGTPTYEKSTDGTTFTAASGSTTFATDDVLRVNVSGYDGYLSLTIPRIA